MRTLNTIERWIVSSVTEKVIPADEHNIDALIYNLVQLLWDGGSFVPYAYKPEQDIEIKRLKAKYQ